MNDRFKFRAWNKLSNEMKDVISLNINYEFLDCSNVILETNTFDNIKTHNNPIICANGLNNVVLMQCTGLKDKNGKLIYEGDIVNVLIDSIKPHYIKQVVVWDRKEWQLKTYNKDYRKNCNECGRQLRTKCKCCSEYFSATGHTNFKEFYNGIVIGNIYENKELLESEG